MNWGDVVSVEPLASGANNEILLVHFSRRKVILKRTRKAGIHRLGSEAFLLQWFGGCPAPALVCPPTLAQGDVVGLWMEQVSGEHAHHLSAEQASLLGITLREIHERDVSSLQGRLEAPTWQEYFQRRLIPQLELSRGKCPGDLHATLESLLGAILDDGSKLGEDLASQGRCLVHTDLIPLNVLFDNGVCSFIDWELGRLDYPEWDMISIDKAFRFEEGARERFENAYGRSLDSKKLRFFSLLHYANVALWRVCSFYVRGENRDIAEKFLTELDQEIAWIRIHLPA